MDALAIDELVIWGSIALESNLSVILIILLIFLKFGLEFFVITLFEIQDGLKLRSNAFVFSFLDLLLSKPVQMALNMFEIAIKLVLVSLLNDLLKKFEALQGTFDVLLSTRCKHLVWKSEIAFDQNTHDFNLVLYVRLLNHLFNFLA